MTNKQKVEELIEMANGYLTPFLGIKYEIVHREFIPSQYLYIKVIIERHKEGDDICSPFVKVIEGHPEKKDELIESVYGEILLDIVNSGLEMTSRVVKDLDLKRINKY